YCFRKFLELVFICSLFRHLQAVVCLAWCAIPGHEGRQRLSKIHLSCCQSSLCTRHAHTHTRRHTHTHSGVCVVCTLPPTHAHTHTHTHTHLHLHTHTRHSAVCT